MTDQSIHAVRLTCSSEADLEDSRLRDTIVAVANGIAERTGVDLVELEVTPHGLELAVRGASIVALGLAAELRRTTDRWHLDRCGTHLWISPEDEDDRTWEGGT